MKLLSPIVLLPVLAVAVAAVAVVDCEARPGGDAGWWCRDSTQAMRHARGLQSCWRQESHCEGMCEQQPTAYCYKQGTSDYCLASAAQCDRAQADDPRASTTCKAVR